MDSLKCIYTLASDTVATNNHIHFIKQLENHHAIIVNSLGNDPCLYLPHINFAPAHKYMLSIEAEAQDRQWQLYYLTDKCQDYSQERCVEFSISPDDCGGQPEADIILPHNLCPQSLRIDVGSQPGEITIKKLKVYELPSGKENSHYSYPIVSFEKPKIANSAIDNSDNTLVVLKTHHITPLIINEYNKIHKSGFPVVLFIDNHSGHFPIFENKFIGSCSLYGVKIDYFLCNKKLLLDNSLPLISQNGLNDALKMVMWYNADFPVYLIRKYFPQYKFYWQLEYDIFYNDRDYTSFFNKHNNCIDDLIISKFAIMRPDHWEREKSEWIYGDRLLYSAFYPVSRLSGAALDFLYRKKLEHARIFKEFMNDPAKASEARWIHCELFTATELAANGFSCVALKEFNIQHFEKDLEGFISSKKYLAYDRQMYHPIKSASFLAELPDAGVSI